METCRRVFWSKSLIFYLISGREIVKMDISMTILLKMAVVAASTFTPDSLYVATIPRIMEVVNI